jgi:hypothetical protein
MESLLLSRRLFHPLIARSFASARSEADHLPEFSLSLSRGSFMDGEAQSLLRVLDD